MNRRGFLRNGIVGLGALALGAKMLKAVPEEAKTEALPVATSGYVQVHGAPTVSYTVTSTSTFDGQYAYVSPLAKALEATVHEFNRMPNGPSKTAFGNYWFGEGGWKETQA